MATSRMPPYGGGENDEPQLCVQEYGEWRESANACCVRCGSDDVTERDVIALDENGRTVEAVEEHCSRCGESVFITETEEAASAAD